MIFRQVIRHLLMFCLIASMSLPLLAGGEASSASMPNFEFPYYGQTLTATAIDAIKVKSVRDHDVARAWREYQQRDAESVLSFLRGISDQLGLNDWFVFQLVRSYVDGLLVDATPIDRVLLEHYLLVKLNYDVRLARTERQLILMVPFDQEVYEHEFIRVGGKDYYLFFDDLEADRNEKSVIYPCDPSKKDIGKGRIFSLSFDDKPLTLPSAGNRLCDFDDGMIRLSCEVSPCLMKMLNDYPLMDLRFYAVSVVLPQFRAAIEDQLRPQLEGMSQCDAADVLLHFVQSVFGYQDDLDQFGRDKVNFVEENFYYDNNDCDDRSVLFAYLVNSLLGLDVQFVQYPGHDCTGVRFTECSTMGNGYYIGDDYYLICDPSYVGATIGRCMPMFSSTKPVVKTMHPVLASDGLTTPLEPRLDKRLIVADISLDPTVL